VGENGSGKTTLIKLLTRLYRPTKGRITLDGTDLEDWDAGALKRRIGVIFQDYARYQMLVGENVGTGDVRAFSDETRWREAAEQGEAREMIETLPEGFRTQLGKWFKNGRELSGGQWQKIALARAFMRKDADILVLDEPTAAMDAAAEANVFQWLSDVGGRRVSEPGDRGIAAISSGNQGPLGGPFPGQADCSAASRGAGRVGAGQHQRRHFPRVLRAPNCDVSCRGCPAGNAPAGRP
jgi:ABC-type lipoprotein export system ATPase subunit